MGTRHLGFLLAAGLVVGLAGCGEAPPPTAGGKTVGHWVEALKGPDVRGRRKAVRVLGNVGAADPQVLPALIGAVKDEDPGVRAAAAAALLKMGPAARDAVPALTEACRDDDPRVREYAARALKVIQAGE